MPDFQPGDEFTCKGRFNRQNADGSCEVQIGPTLTVNLYPDQMHGLTLAPPEQKAPPERPEAEAPEASPEE
jgi:hypothetical protein